MMLDYKRLVLDQKKRDERLNVLNDRMDRLYTLHAALVSDFSDLSSSEDAQRLLEVDVEIAQILHEYKLELIAHNSNTHDLEDFVDKEVEARECQKKTS